MNNKFDRDSVTDENIRNLEVEAGRVGDIDQTMLCRRALNGDANARELCIDAIEDAAAQADL